MENTPDPNEKFDDETSRRQLDTWLGGTSVMAALDSEWGPQRYQERTERAKQEAEGQPTCPEYREFPEED